MFNIYEQPWTLVSLAGILLLAVWGYRSVAVDKRYWWQFLIPVIVAAAGFGLDCLVQTNLEQIKDVLQRASKAVESEDSKALGELISEDYRDSYHRSKSRFMAHCENAFAEPLIKKSITKVIAIEIDLPKAEVVFTTRLVFDKDSPLYQDYINIMLVKLRMKLEKNPQKGWLISSAEIKEINHQPAGWGNTR